MAKYKNLDKFQIILLIKLNISSHFHINHKIKINKIYSLKIKITVILFKN